MNNNRNQNNNRRRGRGNRNQGGGGSQGNRIDSRARGNAPQLLDKYKKLAQDAQHNGDRVQAEYYLQFADHYFRVIADNRSRQDEQRGDQRSGRRDDREDEFETEDEMDGDRRFDVRDRDNRDREARDNRDRESRDNREGRRERPRRDFRRDEQNAEDRAGEATTDGSAFEPDENPFVRDAREPRDERPKRRTARPRRGDEGEATGIDAAALPPAFSANDTANDTGDGPVQDAPRRPRRKRGDGEGDTLSAVG